MWSQQNSEIAENHELFRVLLGLLRRDPQRKSGNENE